MGTGGCVTILVSYGITACFLFLILCICTGVRTLRIPSGVKFYDSELHQRFHGSEISRLK